MQRLPNLVWLLGWISLCTDFASEMLYPVVPLFLVHGLGASPVVLGIIEGSSEALVGLLKGVIGRWSDRVGRRREFVIAGYTLSGLVKPIPAVLPVWWSVFGGKLLDRLGKALRTAPRDALLAAVAPEGQRGRVFGFHRSMDTWGAVLGPLAALGWLGWMPGAYRELFALTLVPSAVAIVLSWRIREPRVGTPSRASAAPERSATRMRLPSSVYRALLFWGAFAIGFPGMAFVVLRLRDFGNDLFALGAYTGYNLLYAVAAAPMGRLFDRFGRRAVLQLGVLLCAVACAVLAIGRSAVIAPLAVVGLGVGMAALETASRAWIADITTAEVRGTALGLYATVGSIAAFGAALWAGWLWEHFGAAAPFLWALGCSGCAFALLWRVPPAEESHAQGIAQARD